jgi:hypothetical protein
MDALACQQPPGQARSSLQPGINEPSGELRKRVARRREDGGAPARGRSRHHLAVIGTFLRFFLLRVIGARGAAILGAIAFILGRRRQRDLPRRGEIDRTS